MKFVFDIDGTICFRNNIINEDILEALKKLENLGHEVIFASARSYRDCLPVIKDFPGNMVVGLNGGVVYNNDEVVFVKEINIAYYKEIITLVDYYTLPVFVDEAFNYAYEKDNHIVFFPYVDPLKLAKELPLLEIEKPIKIVVPIEDVEILNAFYRLLAKKNVDFFYHEEEKILYINSYETTKGSTLLDVLNDDYVCFGNDKNDITMFQNAKYAVQVGKYAELKQFANEIISEEEVAAKIIELSKKF